MSSGKGMGMLMIVEDDASIAQGLALNLQLEGYSTRIVARGDEVLDAVLEDRPSLLLLDIGLPGVNGMEVLRRLRRELGELAPPVIVVSARQAEFDKVTALRLGADDHVAKPFGVAELLARIEAVLRRTGQKGTPAPEAITEGSGRSLGFGDVEMNEERRRVTRGGEEVELTHLQFELLRFLLLHPHRVYSREQLLERVWGLNHSGSARTVDNFVRHLRKKLEADPRNPGHLLTVRGSGYRFEP